jgi:hypothetical protein
MMNDKGSSNDRMATGLARGLWHSHFGIISTFDIRHSTFDICHSWRRSGLLLPEEESQALDIALFHSDLSCELP